MAKPQVWEAKFTPESDQVKNAADGFERQLDREICPAGPAQRGMK